MKLSYRTAIAATLFSLLPAAAHACSACILADPKTSGTYLKMTLVMSALPLSLLGGLTYWLWRRYSPRSRAAVSARQSVEIRSGRSVLEHHGI
jgi:hypothetical protein